MDEDSKKDFINPVILSIIDSKRIATNDQPRLKPKNEATRAHLAPPGTVGTERTARQQEAERHNSQIQQKINLERERKANQRNAGGITNEFKERARQID